MPRCMRGSQFKRGGTAETVDEDAEFGVDAVELERDVRSHGTAETADYEGEFPVDAVELERDVRSDESFTCGRKLRSLIEDLYTGEAG